MDLKALKKLIAQAAYAVRGGDESKREELKSLRAKHREICGVAQPEAPAPAPKESQEPSKPAEPEPEDKPKKGKKSKE